MAELFKAGLGAQLYLVEGGERLLMQSGRFCLMLVKNPVSQLAAVVAIVGEVQWPVGRDSCVVREEEGSFTFTLPGPIKYNLVLPSDTADLQRLEHILREYSHCQQKHSADQQFQEKESSQGKELTDSKKRSSICDIRSSRMTGRMLRARRMSAVAKVFSKSLERGAIKADSHVEPMDAVAPRRQILSGLALASVDAVAKVVDAVETGGRTLLETARSAATAVASEEEKHKQDASFDSTLSNLINSGWTLNKLGLLMLFRVITASMAIHSGGSSSGGSSRSGSSSSSDFRRLLSSSSSSSSFSSRSLKIPSHVQGAAATADAMSTALSIQQPTPTGTSMSSASPVVPPPPLFSQQSPRVQHSHMPPPCGPPPLMAGTSQTTNIESLDSTTSTPFRVYKPHPTPAVATTSAPPPPPPPPFLPRPRRFQPPPKS